MRPRILPAAVAVAAAFVPLLLASPAYATNGYIPHGHGIKSKGMGGAGMALSHAALAAAGNPAGMATLGNRVDFGIDWFRPTGREAKVVGSPAPLLR